MIDPISAISIAAAVTQFVGLGIKVAQRLAEYNAAAPTETPRSLANISAQLPLLVNALGKVKSEQEVDRLDTDTKCLLRGVVLGCMSLVQDVERISTRIAPESGESLRTKLKKVLSGLGHEQRIAEIERGLAAYIQVLILHQVVDKAEVEVGAPEEARYFGVKEKPVDDYDPVAHERLVKQLDAAFYAAARSQASTPTYVVLRGDARAGKTQLALAYARDSHDLGQFPTVFWLDAADPEALRLGLEGAAALVRHSREGSREEKLAFIDRFLAERWHPWLLVLDGYNHKAFDGRPLAELLPREGYGAVLITTRDASAASAHYLGGSSGSVVFEVPRFMTEAERKAVLVEATTGVWQKDMAVVEKVMAGGFDPNRYDSNGWVFLNRAALLGLERAVELFLAAGADINFDRAQASALRWAAGDGYLAICAMLLDHEERAGVRFDREEYAKAAASAVKNGHLDVVKFLIDRRDVALDPTDLDLRSAFENAAGDGKLDALKQLHSLNALPALDSEECAAALVSAVSGKHAGVAEFLAKEVGLPLDKANDYGQTPLLMAAKDGANDMVAMLLAAGAPVNMPTPPNSTWPITALHAAASNGHVSTVKLLLEAGADPLLQPRGMSPALVSAYKYTEVYPLLVQVPFPDEATRRAYFATALFAAARSDNRDLALAVLPELQKKGVGEEKEKEKKGEGEGVNGAGDAGGDGKGKGEEGEGIDVRDDDGSTALHIALHHWHVPVARFLIRSGSRLDLPDADGDLPVTIAARAGLELVVRDLARAAAKEKKDKGAAGSNPGVEVKNKEGETPLIVAVKNKREKVVKVLVDAGVDLEEGNKFGETALDVAEEMGLKRIVDLLEGRDPDAK